MLCLMLMGRHPKFHIRLAIGFDMMAAEAIIVSLKRSYPDITLIAAIPFKGQACRFSF